MKMQAGKNECSKKQWKNINEWKEENMTMQEKQDKWKLKIPVLAVKTIILMTE